MATISEETIQDDLKTLAGKLGIEVRIERFYGTGGLCVVKNVKKLIINKDLPIEKQNEIMVDELSKFDLENVYLSPLLRRIMGEEDAGDDLRPYTEEEKAADTADDGDAPDAEGTDGDADAPPPAVDAETDPAADETIA